MLSASGGGFGPAIIDNHSYFNRLQTQEKLARLGRITTKRAIHGVAYAFHGGKSTRPFHVAHGEIFRREFRLDTRMNQDYTAFAGHVAI